MGVKYSAHRNINRSPDIWTLTATYIITNPFVNLDLLIRDVRLLLYYGGPGVLYQGNEGEVSMFEQLRFGQDWPNLSMLIFEGLAYLDK